MANVSLGLASGCEMVARPRQEQGRLFPGFALVRASPFGFTQPLAEQGADLKHQKRPLRRGMAPPHAWQSPLDLFLFHSRLTIYYQQYGES
jgi:hypothetical protein